MNHDAENVSAGCIIPAVIIGLVATPIAFHFQFLIGYICLSIFGLVLLCLLIGSIVEWLSGVRSHWLSKGSKQHSKQYRYISASVKRAVWDRDEGMCVDCDSDQNLHFDHIIPVVRGGGGHIQNVQILCADCNLRKSSKIQ